MISFILPHPVSHDYSASFAYCCRLPHSSLASADIVTIGRKPLLRTYLAKHMPDNYV